MVKSLAACQVERLVTPLQSLLQGGSSQQAFCLRLRKACQCFCEVFWDIRGKRTPEGIGSGGDWLCNWRLCCAINLLHTDQSAFTLGWLGILFPFSSCFKKNYCIYI